MALNAYSFWRKGQILSRGVQKRNGENENKTNKHQKLIWNFEKDNLKYKKPFLFLGILVFKKFLNKYSNQYSKTKKKFFYLKISFSKFPSDLLTTQTIPKKLPLRGSEKESVV